MVTQEKQMILRHKRFMDVCFQANYFFKDNSYIGRWINMGYVKSWFVPAPTEMIYIDDKTDWEKCTETDVYCLRYTTWEPL